MNRPATMQDIILLENKNSESHKRIWDKLEEHTRMINEGENKIILLEKVAVSLEKTTESLTVTAKELTDLTSKIQAETQANSKHVGFSQKLVFEIIKYIVIALLGALVGSYVI